MNFRYSFSRLALATLLTTSSLPTLAEPLKDITLRFAGEFDGKPADCTVEYEGIGLASTTVGIADYRLYVSRVRLLDADGNETPVTLSDHGPWQHGDIALLDFENGGGNCSNGTAQTNDEIRGQVPAGDYRGVAFDIGIPFENNHQDPTLTASPLNLTALFWNWRGGYRFLRLDLVPKGGVAQTEASGKATGALGKQGMATQHVASPEKGHKMKKGKGGHGNAGWALHLGSTGCLADSPTNAPESCGSPNRVAVSFAQADPFSSVFVMDPAAVLTQSDLTRNTRGTSPGCMSAMDDPECDSILEALGLTSDNAAQALVSVR